VPANRIDRAKLNDTNEGYGSKSSPVDWAREIQLSDELYTARFEAGAYNDVIEMREAHLASQIAKNPQQMDELNLKDLYLVGKSHLALGHQHSAIACFKLIDSQAGFRKGILPDFRKYLDAAAAQLEQIAGDIGYEQVNSVDVQEYLAEHKKKGGCFVATAAYGSPLAEEVCTLRRFRDEVLDQSVIGSWLVRFYYYFSPPIASRIERSALARTLVQSLLTPVVLLARWSIGE
jgi:hypothetical protein